LLGKARRRKTLGLRRFRGQREDSPQLAAQLDLERAILGDEADLVDQRKFVILDRSLTAARIRW
jgi:hypothetical protein